MTTKRRHRLSLVSKLLLGDYRTAIGGANAAWLISWDHDDWLDNDFVRITEMLPAELHGVLHAIDDE